MDMYEVFKYKSSRIKFWPYIIFWQWLFLFYFIFSLEKDITIQKSYKQFDKHVN